MKHYKECNKKLLFTRQYRGSKLFIYVPQNILTFDIECSNLFTDGKGVWGYNPDYPEEFWEDKKPFGLPYIWQCSIDEDVFYGRHFAEFRDFITNLKYEHIDEIPDMSIQHTIYIYVHNESYEFQFLTNIFNFTSVFARSPRKPMRAYAPLIDNFSVEFRCTYAMTQTSLEEWGNKLGVPKLVGQLDYDKVRTPLTPLTKKELEYAERDCVIVYKGIQKFLEEYKTHNNIPMTQTGRIRREVKTCLGVNKKNNREYKRLMDLLLPLNPEDYKRLKEVYAGGYTHANMFYSGKVIKGPVEHYDFTSSYPTVMICEKFPMSHFDYIYLSKFPTKKMMKENAYIIDVEFFDIECVTQNTFIQLTKSKVTNAIIDNGRVRCADTLRILVTEHDLQVILDTYEFDHYVIHDSYVASKGYLPKPFVEYLLKLYYNKSTLKGNDDLIDSYNKAKEYLNGCYGMAVTKLVMDMIAFEDGEWHIQVANEDAIIEALHKYREPYNKQIFLSYAWGVWVSSIARSQNLWRVIQRYDSICLYSDTDSIFIKGHADLSWYNGEIIAKLDSVLTERGIDPEKSRPLGIQLGIMTKEPTASEFITLGAKRYCQRIDDKLEITISGVNKEAVEVLNDDISNFKNGLTFDRNLPSVKKLTACYNDNSPIINVDGYQTSLKRTICLVKRGYTVKLASEYEQLLELCENTYYDFSEKTRISMKGM